MAGSTVTRGIVLAVAGCVCWGFSAACVQLVTGDSGCAAPVEWAVCVRLITAGALLLAVCLAVPKFRAQLHGLLSSRKSVAMLLAYAVVGLLFNQLAYLSAIRFTNAGTGTLLENVGTALILVVSCVMTRKLPSARNVVGLVLAMTGVLLLATKGNLETLAIGQDGLLWGLLAAVSMVTYTMMPETLVKEWGSVAVNAVGLLTAGVLACAIWRPWTYGVQVSAPLVGGMAGLVLVGTVAAFLLYLQGVADAGPVRVGMLACVEPLSAMVIAAVWLGTQVGLADAAGCACIVAMVFLVSRKE